MIIKINVTNMMLIKLQIYCYKSMFLDRLDQMHHFHILLGQQLDSNFFNRSGSDLLNRLSLHESNFFNRSGSDLLNRLSLREPNSSSILSILDDLPLISFYSDYLPSVVLANFSLEILSHDLIHVIRLVLVDTVGWSHVRSRGLVISLFVRLAMSVNVLGVHIMRVLGLSDAISVVEFVDGLLHSLKLNIF